MAGITNRGKYKILASIFNAVALPTSFYAALVTTTPTADTNIKSELTEAANGTGYTTGGLILAKNTTDFPTLTEDDTLDKATIKIKNLAWTASAGLLPSNAGATHLILTDDNATQGSREVWAFWSLGAARQVSDTQQLQVNNAEIDITE
jgi:hypothetical protein